jgi:hypothetical protein
LWGTKAIGTCNSGMQVCIVGTGYWLKYVGTFVGTFAGIVCQIVEKENSYNLFF